MCLHELRDIDAEGEVYGRADTGVYDVEGENGIVAGSLPKARSPQPEGGS
jgi:hypothetical protein